MRCLWVGWCLVALAVSGCVKRVPLFHTVLRLPEGRFMGPIEVPVPRHADHQGHDFDVFITLRTQCGPKLTLAFPDGEQRALGRHDAAWQSLLSARAQGQPLAQLVMPPSVVGPPPPQQLDAVPSAGAGVDVTVETPALVVGRWQAQQLDRWPGQVEFEAMRAERCAETQTFTTKYRNAFDDTNTVALWAEVPQELSNAELTIEMIELIPPPKHAPVVAPVEPSPAVAASVVAHVESKPRPPKPADRVETPSPSEVPAQWASGSWVWVEAWGGGEWRWAEGSWQMPSVRPAPPREGDGVPPLPGCVWVNGSWSWNRSAGSWLWVSGHWGPPPPIDEDRGQSPDPTSVWRAGNWYSVGAGFTWAPGAWSKPQARVERMAPPPSPGAAWVPGDWLNVAGTWVWSPGFYDTGGRPPPPMAETPPPTPSPDAVWLAGFWRFDSELRRHTWVGGHWERPPAEGSVWVPEVVLPGMRMRGRWELRVRPQP